MPQYLGAFISNLVSAFCHLQLPISTSQHFQFPPWSTCPTPRAPHTSTAPGLAPPGHHAKPRRPGDPRVPHNGIKPQT